MLYTRPTSSQAQNDDDDNTEALLPDGSLDTMSLRFSLPTRIPARARVSGLGRTIARSCLAFAAFLNSSFINLTSSTKGGHLPAPTRPPPSKTQYLDGMRGIALLIVVNLHESHETFPPVDSGWGYGDNHGFFFLLPFVRLVHCGAAMVSLFAISGYVIAYRRAQQMHRGLTSFTFRRGIRLYALAVTPALLTFVAASLNLIDIPRRSGGRSSRLSRSSTWESNVWTWDLASGSFYNPQFWTMSLQFRGSMVLYIATAGPAGSCAFVRVLAETVITAHACIHMRWDIALF